MNTKSENERKTRDRKTSIAKQNENGYQQQQSPNGHKRKMNLPPPIPRLAISRQYPLIEQCSTKQGK